MASILVPCAQCHCHAKSTEVTCPSCGEPLRRSDGSIPRTTVAVLLGLTAASTLAGACGSVVAPEPFYGPAMTTSSSSSSGTGGTGGSATATFYGPSLTTSSSSSSGGGNDGGGNDGG